MKTWVVVASAARARIFESLARRQPMRELEDLINPEEPLPPRSLKSDRHGRAVDSRGGRGHAMQARVGPKEQLARRFAKRVVGSLDRGLRRNRFERLCLIAPPHFLGLLRSQMDPGLARTVEVEVQKDLTREDPMRIRAQVQMQA